MSFHSQESPHHLSNQETARAVLSRLNLQNRLGGVVVDCDRTRLHVNSTILACFSVETHAVSSGAVALELFNSGYADFDIVLVEQFMPVMNGQETDCRLLSGGDLYDARESIPPEPVLP